MMRLLISLLLLFFTSSTFSQEVCTQRWKGFHGIVPVFSNQASWRSQYSLQGASYVCFEAGTDRSSFNGTQLCNRITCNGDFDYCFNRTCNTTSPYYCRRGSVSGSLNFIIEGNWIPVTNLSSDVSCRNPSDMEQGSVTTIADLYSHEVLSRTVTQTTLRMRFKSGKRHGSIVLSYSTLTESLNITRHTRILSLSSKKRSDGEVTETMTGNVNSLSVSFPDGDLTVLSHSAFIASNLTNDDYCTLGQCDQCETNPQWANCKAHNFGYLNLTIILVILMLTLCMLPWIATCLGLVIRACKCMFKGLKCLCCIRKSVILDEQEVELTSSEKELEMNEADEDETIEVAGRMVRIKKKKQSRPSSQATMVMLALVIFSFSLPVVSSQCTGIVTAVTNVNRCVRYNVTHIECKTRPSISAALSGPSSSACIELRTANGTVYGSMTINFDSMTATQQLTRQYVTSTYTVSPLSYRSCGNEGCANTYSGSCAGWRAAGSPNPCGLFPQSFTTGQYRIDCFSSCMCSGCGCGWCFGEAPVWAGFRLVPAADTFTVFQPGLTTYESRLTIILTTQDGRTQRQITTTAPVFSDGYLTASLQGTFIDFNINWASKSILVHDSSGTSWLVDAASSNMPVRETIGDIQASSASDLLNGNFRWPTNLVQMTLGTTQVSYSYPGPGVSYRTYFPTFPTAFTGFTWTYGAGSLRAPITRALSSLINIQLNQDVSVYFTSDLVCPEFSIVSTTGCYSCGLAARISIRFRSSCQPGVCALSSTVGQMLNTSISLENNWKEGEILGYFGTKAVTSVLTITCTERSWNSTLVATLADPNPINPLAPSSNADPGNAPSDSSIGSGFFGLDKIGGEIALSFLIIGCVVLAVLIIILVLYCVYRSKGMSNALSMFTGVNAFRSMMAPPYEKIPMEGPSTM